MSNTYNGLLFIGDPHLASRVPGFRKDDYTQAILNKIDFALKYGAENRLLPIMLGDLFHRPRDNSNSLLTKLIRLLEGHFVLGITGNHDTTEKHLQDDDSLSIIMSTGRLHLIDQLGPWKGKVNNVPIFIGGTPWSDRLPEKFEAPENQMVIWITHHNIGFTDDIEGWLKPVEIPGIHIIVNGHLHRPSPDKVCGMTTWINPGSIARVSRTDAIKDFVPSAHRFIPSEKGKWGMEPIPLPHAPFEEVFYPNMEQPDSDHSTSAFIQGLESIQSLRTSGGAGLIHFINDHIGQFDKEVADVILQLVKEVCPDECAK